MSVSSVWTLNLKLTVNLETIEWEEFQLNSQGFPFTCCGCGICYAKLCQATLHSWPQTGNQGTNANNSIRLCAYFVPYCFPLSSSLIPLFGESVTTLNAKWKDSRIVIVKFQFIFVFGMSYILKNSHLYLIPKVRKGSNFHCLPQTPLQLMNSWVPTWEIRSCQNLTHWR